MCNKVEMFLFSRGYLRDLIEAFHIFLKMLEKYCSGKTHMVVQVSLSLQDAWCISSQAPTFWVGGGEMHTLLYV